MTAREHGNVGRSFEMRPDTLVKFFARCDAFRKPQRFLDMLRASECDHRGRTGLELQPFPQAAYLEGALQAAQAIDAGAIAQQTQPQRIPEAILAARTAQVAAYVERHRPAQA
jgi:tRNA nucleotidyltransferase (CCA-adding enzyme)